MKINSSNYSKKMQTKVPFKSGFVKKTMLLIPLTLFSSSFRTLDNCAKDVFNKTEKIITANKKEITRDLLKGLNIITETNFRGGKTIKFDSISVEKLKPLIKRDSNEISYVAPIKNTPNVYLCEFGMFGAKRPNGRPHMGLDIFTTKYSRKPQKPVLISSPIDGVVIASKKANENDNLIANSVTILGVDGRKYAFDHMARAKDYPKDKTIPLPETGEIVTVGDSIGYVGNTGETDLWHLHLSVMTDEGLKKQMTDKKWVQLSKKSQYTPLNGQVNPLSEKDVGEIAKLLNQYTKAD